MPGCRGGRRARARCVRGSTRTGRCWRTGGSPTTSDGLARFADACLEAFAGQIAWSSRSRRSSSGTGRAGSPCWSGCWPRSPDVDADAARRQAWRHRLDDGRLRGRLPRATVPRSGGRGDALALPRLRLTQSRRSTPRRTRGAGCSCWPARRTRRGHRCSSRLPAGGRWRSRWSTPPRRATRVRAASGDVGLVVGATADHGLDLVGPQRPGARPRARGPGRGPRRHRGPFPRCRGPRPAVGEPLGAGGGPGRRSAALGGGVPPRRSDGRAAPLTRSGARVPARHGERTAVCGPRRHRCGGRNRSRRPASMPLVAVAIPIAERVAVRS